MSPISALALYPLWAVALAVGLTALRLGRSVGRGLVLLCFALAIWVTGLVLLVRSDQPAAGAFGSPEIAERVLPLGMLLAGAFLHAGADIAGITTTSGRGVGLPGSPPLVVARRIVRGAYGFGLAIALFGALFPRLLYGPGVRGPGPLFYPLAVLCAAGAAFAKLWLLSLARAAEGPRRTRAIAISVANLTATIGGAGAVLVRVFDLAPIEAAAPFLLLAIVLATFAVVFEEKGRAREVLVQALSFALITALLSSIGLLVYFRALPHLVPRMTYAWLGFVLFLGALPLDPLRAIVVEAIGGAVFERPIAIRRLAQEIEAKETEREQVEGLAELGRLASAVAHEIRNPLGVILAQAKVLEKRGAEPENVAEIRAQVERAKRFLDDLLRFAKPRPLALREVEVRGVLAMAASNVRQALALDEAKDPFRLDEGPPLFVEADRAALLDVATALFTNAAIAVSSEPRGGAVHVAARDAGASIEIAVTDDGPGVPPEIEPRLFQLFVTGRGRDHAHPGTGIGLALASRWVSRHGGTLRHERAAPTGARFVVDWPKAPST